MGRVLISGAGLRPSKFIVAFIIITFLFSSISIAAPLSEPSGIKSESPAPETRGWVDDEYVISYDEPGVYNAHDPDIAVAPPGSPYEGSIHAVWAELNNSVDNPYVEIHYSMSRAGDGGLQWSNDDASEGDRLISQDYTSGKGAANPGNASDPSIAIDPLGWIHVVWSEQYPDGTYEVHYSRSEDNGKTWTGYDGTGDTLITQRTGEDSWWINQPRIAVTTQPLIIHVVWDELPFNGDSTEIWYARSDNQGITWSLPIQISAPSAPGEPSASEPDIATGGPNREIVHVVWTQESILTSTSEVYYQRSSNAGLDWGQERVISWEVSDGNHAGRARVAAVDDNIHAIWDQSGGGSSEVFYSGSSNGGETWSGEGTDTKISFSDGNDVTNPTIVTWGGANPSIHVIWTELDETSTYGTQEIHYSMTHDPSNPSSWTGRDADIVLSHPDTGEFAEAHNPAMGMGVVDGKVRPQIVWDEINTVGPSGKADRNTEIHYLPDTSFDAPIHLGWNLISCPLVQNDSSILNVLDDSGGDGNTTWDMVRGYTNNGTITTWTSYCTAKPASLNSLWNIDNRMGFWINITSLGDGYLTFSGDYDVSTTIQLKAGWNLVGYPAHTSKNITDSLGSINDLPVEGYSANASYLIVQLPSSYMMQAGEGYWVHVPSDTIWTVDW